MKTSEFMEHISDNTSARDRWRQDKDVWLNLWRCLRGNAIAVRYERDSMPMKETTALNLAKEYCKNCYNKEGCKFYDLYR